MFYGHIYMYVFLNMSCEIGYVNVILPDPHVERIWKMTLNHSEYVSKVLIRLKLVRGEYTTAPSRNREGERLCEGRFTVRPKVESWPKKEIGIG